MNYLLSGIVSRYAALPDGGPEQYTDISVKRRAAFSILQTEKAPIQ
jgi:hypothetical protein